eukprot:NODE_2313_length_1213_cov_57.483425_g2200_i0.p1 GENE.NODE_2313_length_1213_cov_57.483425_g2200_i0~~NODE_2313_length_1213_cov_57.483425_g2200_i0.p1  ORF type:complete len:371 (+),score=108.93 NODE_2313_length_1213_cov_57.483425_g2200_i0:35-1114(+)
MANSMRLRVPPMANSLYIVPKDPPKEILGNYDPRGVEFKKAAAADRNVDLPRHNPALQVASMGKGSALLSKMQSTAHSMQSEVVPEDALDVWNKSRQGIMEEAQRRQDILTAPMATQAPDRWVTTNQATHVNLLPALQPETSELVFKDGQPRALCGKAPATLRHATACASMDFTDTYRTRDSAMKATEQLRAELKEQQQSGVFVSRNGTTLKVDALPLNQTITKAPNVGQLQTTTGSTYGAFDRSFYRDPEQPNRLDLSPEEEAYVQARLAAAEQRNTGIYVTSNAENFTDKSAFAEVDPQHHKPQYFNKKHGALLMRRGDDPTLNPTNLQRTHRTSDVVPDHYTTTQMHNSVAFRKFQ